MLEGGCTPLPFDEFSVQFDDASRRVNVSQMYAQMYAQIEQRQYTGPAEIRSQFMLANPELASSGLSLLCSGHELSEIRICLA